MTAWIDALPASDAEWWERCESGVVARSEDHVLGLCVRRGALIDYLYVAPEAQRRGIGTAFLEGAEQAARDDGFTALTTYASLAARVVFERCGYRVAEVRHPVRGGAELTNMRMIKQLTEQTPRARGDQHPAQ